MTFLWSSPWGHSPALLAAGSSRRGRSGWEKLAPKGQKSTPQQETRFPPPLAGGNSRASASRGHSRLWVPPADHQEEDEPGGSSKGEEGPCCVPARGRGLRSSNHLQPSPRHIKLPPAPQLGHVPCGKGTTRATKSHKGQLASAVLNFTIPAAHGPSPVSKGRAEPKPCPKPLALGLFSGNSPLSTY